MAEGSQGTRQLRCRVIMLFGCLLALLAYRVSSGIWYVSDFLSRPDICDAPVDSRMQSAMDGLKKLGFPGFQISYASGGAQWNCADGWAVREFPPRAVELKSQFRLASVTKALTSFVALDLIEKGSIDLSDRMVDLLGIGSDFSDARMSNITVQHLLMHSAGFDRRVQGDPMLTATPWCPHDLSVLKKINLGFDPGSRYVYSNLGYCLLGEVIARVEGMPLSKVFQERIFSPAGLSLNIVGSRGGVVSSYSTFGALPNGAINLDYAALVAAGGWSGSAGDLSRVLSYLSGNYMERVKKRDVDGCLPEVFYSCHGYMFYFSKFKDRKAMYWRDGSLPGVTSFVGIFADGSTVVFLGNMRGDEPRPNLEVIKLLYGIFG